MTRLLVVTAVEAERDAVTRGLAARGDLLGWQAVSVADTPFGSVTVLAGGVGPAAAAASTAIALSTASALSTATALSTASTSAESPFDLVLCAGIGGGIGVEPGSLVCASDIIFADLGAENGPHFETATELGFGRNNYPVDPDLAAGIARRTGATLGSVLTVATVTGRASTADQWRRRHPQARAEAMEGAGVAAAATELGVPYGELRAISNEVGPRDRAAWRIPAALDALAQAMLDLTSVPWEAS